MQTILFSVLFCFLLHYLDMPVSVFVVVFIQFNINVHQFNLKHNQAFLNDINNVVLFPGLNIILCNLLLDFMANLRNMMHHQQIWVEFRNRFTQPIRLSRCARPIFC